VRVQGADLTQAADKTAPKVEIIRHPDVRRMLMEQKAHAEGMRALVMFTGWIQDQAQLAGHGEAGDPEEHDRWIAREDLLLPLVKGYCSEKAYELLSLSLQTFGGSGYTQDYPIEQYLRDAKIDTLYEGTTAIQALDLLFRKIVRDQGATLSWLADQIRELVKGGTDGDAGDDGFAAEREHLGAALDEAQGHLGVLLQHAMASTDESRRAEIYKTGLHSTEFLASLAEVVIAWLLLRHAEIAQDQLDAALTGPGEVNAARQADLDFYAGKVASARWFARTVLPKVALRAAKARDEDGWLMTLSDRAF
jgi:hypothetical protein